MTKQNKGFPVARKGAESMNNRANNFIPGTTIPREFYATVKLDLEKVFNGSIFFGKILEDEFNAVRSLAYKEVQDYKSRYRIFKCYGFDPDRGFELDFNYAWCTTDDGTIQLLRMDMLPISERSLNAEIDWLDGKLEEVKEGNVYVLRSIEK